MFDQALELILAGRDAVNVLEKALSEDNRFAMAHAALGSSYAGQGRVADAKRARQRALELIETESVTSRERAHILLAGGIAAGKQEAITEAILHLKQFPLDALLAEQVLGFLFFRGGLGKGKRAMEVCDLLTPAYPSDDWYLIGRRAFVLQELGHHSQAADLAQRALEAYPINGNAMHALAHIDYARGSDESGVTRLREWLNFYEPTARMYGHFWWHIALFYLHLNAPSSALEVYEEHLQPAKATGPRHLVLADVAGFLWRLQRRKISFPREEATEFATTLSTTVDDAFSESQAMLALVACGARAQAMSLAEKPPPRLAGLSAEGRQRVYRALIDFSDGRYDQCIEEMRCVDIEQMEALGGSSIEREAFANLFIEACLAAGRTDEACEALQSRKDLTSLRKLLAIQIQCGKANGAALTRQRIADRFTEVKTVNR